jgi:formate-dependent nitrite reductase cytochrome c552 subunit
MFAGTGGSGVKNMPSEHIKIMPKKCVTCHMHKEKEKQKKADVKMQKGGHTFRSDDKACMKCHENPEVLVKEQNEKTAALLKRLKKLLDSTTDKKSASYRAARLNYNIVMADGGIGVHNPGYAQALLRHGISALTVESVWER